MGILLCSVGINPVTKFGKNNIVFLSNYKVRQTAQN